MSHILYIEASPRKTRSVSIHIAKQAIQAWHHEDPELTVDTLDVWSTDLPEFNGAAVDAKYAGLAGRPLTLEQERAWSRLRAIVERFIKADVIVLASPLWNFSVPYKLKQLIDVVSQKDLLFTFDGAKFSGVLKECKALLICARGLDYGPASGTPAVAFDFQKPYLETWLRFIGISEVRTIVVEKTLTVDDSESRAQACEKAVSAMQNFARRAAKAGSRQ